jgi:putative RecB family exonuclease
VNSGEQQELSLPKTPRLVSCSPTKLSTWVDCPRRYRYAYLDRPAPQKGPAWAHLSYGASAHNALRAWWDLPSEKRTPDGADRVLREVWLTDGYRDDEQSERWREKTARYVTEYASHLDPEDEPLGLERTVGMRTSVLAFSGRVDRIDERNGALVVVDYKMGRSASSDTDTRASMALALYAEATQRTLRKNCRRVELHHLPTGTVAAWDHTDQGIDRHLRRAEGIGQEIRAAIEELGAVDSALASTSSDQLFPTKPGPLCGWCDYRGACGDGQRAGPAHKPWDGLDD